MFLPVVGMVVMPFIPRAEEQLLKVVALLTALGHGRHRRRHRWPPSTTTGPGTLQFFVDKPWIDAIHSRFIMGCDGMSLPLYILTMVITLL